MTDRGLELKVGAVLLAALLVLGGFLFLLGDLSWSRNRELSVDFGFSGAIQAGAPVKVSGVKVGRVEELEFMAGHVDDQGAPVQVRLHLALEERAAPVLRENALFYINTQGLLGEHYVEIVPPRNPGAPIASGQVVRGIDPPRFDLLVQRLYDFLEMVSGVLRTNGDDVSQLIRSGAGLAHTFDVTLRNNQEHLDQLLANSAAAAQGAARLMQTLNEARLEKSLADAQGTLALLNRELPKTMSELQKTLTHADRALAVTDGVDPEKVRALLAQTESAMTRANAMLADAQTITRRLESGTGTVGLLLGDDEIYDDLKELLQDLKRHPWKLVWKE